MILSLTLALALTGPPGPDLPADPGPLITAARERQLARDPSWLRLVHYRTRLFGGYESDADGPAFFLAPNGKRDPEAELEATIRAFFAPDPIDPKAQHPQCQFPARRAWLAGQLGLSAAKLPAPLDCPRFREFWERVQATSATMVFSSYYLNNPASAFGHTFLRLNKSDSARGEKRFELIDYGIDYSATVDTSNPVIYAFKGLTGLFPGHFNHYPYFYKVREYGDYESRDIWEYDLNLTPEETAMLVGHLWELGSTWFDYYYLTQNCSHGILSALEAAAPRLDLLSHVGRVVIPADTIKALYRNPGLVREIHFRPSIRTQFQHRTAGLSPEELDAIEVLAEKPTAPLAKPLPPASEARALDATLDYVDYVHAREIMDNVETPAAKLKQQLMERRARLGVQSEERPIPVPMSQQVQLGHDSMRMGIAGGVSRQRGVMVYDFRMALHDLADPPEGYPALSQIEFLPIRLRHDMGSASLELEEAALANIISLSDFGRFQHKVSWKARLGVTTVRDGGCSTCRVGVAELGGGLARSFAGSKLVLFATTDMQLLAGPKLQGTGGSGLRVGVGPTAGVRLRLGERISTMASGSFYYLPASSPRTTHSLGLTTRYHASPFSLWLELRGAPYEKLLLTGALVYF